MPQARKRLVSTKVTPSYRLISGCARRHFLCGVDPLTGKDYSERKQQIKDRLALLAEVFAIDGTRCWTYMDASALSSLILGRFAMSGPITPVSR